MDCMEPPELRLAIVKLSHTASFDLSCEMRILQWFELATDDVGVPMLLDKTRGQYYVGIGFGIDMDIAMRSAKNFGKS